MAHKRKILTVLLLSATPALAAISEDPTLVTLAPVPMSPDVVKAPRQPPPDDQAPRELIALRSKLFEAGAQKARLQVATFKPLCDQDGYPLVGNVASKGKLYQPSAFCADVRKANKS